MVRLIGIVPLGIGLTTLAFAWSDEFGGIGHVPVFARLFVSFISLGFILVGGAILFGGLGPHGLVDQALDLQQRGWRPECASAG